MKAENRLLLPGGEANHCRRTTVCWKKGRGLSDWNKRLGTMALIEGNEVRNYAFFYIAVCSKVSVNAG